MIDRFLAWAKAMKTRGSTISDVIELCTLLQCVGYSVKSLQVKAEGNTSQETGGARTITINCPISGYTAVLETRMACCSCPAPDNDKSGLWSVTGVAQGKAAPQETGHGLIGTVSKDHRDRASKELNEMIRWILHQHQCETEATNQIGLSKSASASVLEMTSPEKNYQLKVDSPLSPVRYRSLDTLTRTDGDMPKPGALDKAPATKIRTSIIRQETYSLKRPSTQLSIGSNKTSSPIKSSANLVEIEQNLLLEVQKVTSEMQRKLSAAISEQLMEVKVTADDSIASLSLDMSKISVQHPEPAKYQFASSPNLSGLARDDMKSGLMKKNESASTSKLEGTKSVEPKMSRLRRLSPNFLKRNSTSHTKSSVPSNNDQKRSSKLNIFKRSPSVAISPIGDPNASTPIISDANKKKYSHIKSTIPRPTPSATLPRPTSTPTLLRPIPSPTFPRKGNN